MVIATNFNAALTRDHVKEMLYLQLYLKVLKIFHHRKEKNEGKKSGGWERGTESIDAKRWLTNMFN